METSMNTRLAAAADDTIPAQPPDGAQPAGPVPMWPLPPERLAEVEFERAGWGEIIDLTERLTADERLAPGYFLDPPWSVKDLLGHLAAWHVEAREQLLDIGARSYQPHDIDIERRNAEILRQLRRQPWDVVWEQATGARAWMLEAWYGLHGPDDEAAEWVRKAGAEHYAEHLPRLRVWVAELVDIRTRPRVDERDP
jgi:hypothetical protein